MKQFEGYVLGIDNKKMYSIIVDSKEDKSYQMDCELEYINIDKKEIKAERKFLMNVSKNGELDFKFLNEKINKHITVDDLKRNMGIENKDSDKKSIDEYIKKGD